MKRWVCFAAMVTAALWTPVGYAQAPAPSDDLARLEAALARIGEGTPADPRQGRSIAHKGMYNAVEFGAKGDGVTDDTAAIQKALDAAAADGGGTVQLPTGRFLIKTHLTFPPHVSLQGVWKKPNRGEEGKHGTVLLAVEGKGDENATPFISMKDNTCISGVTIFYPEQIRANPPHAYPWTIQGQGDDVGILNVTMVNAFKAVDFGTFLCGRHYVDGLYAYPFKMGVFVNQCYDVGRLNNIHLWPFFDLDPNSPLWAYTRENGTGFMFGRTDGEMVSNVFCIFYKVGMHLIGGPIPQAKPNEPTRIEYLGGAGMMTNVYLDVSPCALKVDDSMETSGFTFVNSSFMSQVQIGPRNRGPIRFSACGFWSTKDLETHARLDGMGPVYFEGCQFSNWDKGNTGAPCIDANARRIIITGCDFLTNRPNHHKITLGPNVREAVITSNLMENGVSIANNAPKYADIQIGLNAGGTGSGCIRQWMILGPLPNPAVANPAAGAPTRAGFDTDYLAALGGEAQAVLKDGAKVSFTDASGAAKESAARGTSTNDVHRLDLARRFNTNGGVGYAYTEVEAAEAGEADLLLGSSDSVKVWVNGQQVLARWFADGRDYAHGQEVIKVPVVKGINRILVKEEDAGALYWDFSLELRAANGAPIPVARGR